MQAFSCMTAITAPLLRANIDTDIIIPGDQFISAGPEGLGAGLFANWRYRIGADGARVEVPEFILNQTPYREARILLAGPNFACGSSREAAVWALWDWGIRVVIAPSFGNIFYANCFRRGLLPIVLPEREIENIAGQVLRDPVRHGVTVDLETSMVTAPLGGTYPFAIGRFYRGTLLNGLNPVAAVLEYSPAIDRFQIEDRMRRPWIHSPGLSS